ncbi:hypothetical protein JHK85_028067 [Glycine max]|nr:hypothetical protein JHK85_028067 [Glycine max]
MILSWILHHRKLSSFSSEHGLRILLIRCECDAAVSLECVNACKLWRGDGNGCEAFSVGGSCHDEPHDIILFEVHSRSISCQNGPRRWKLCCSLASNTVAEFSVESLWEELDWESIAPGLLHDTVEDTNVTFERIEEEFGATVRHIVEGETKVHESKIDDLNKEAIPKAKDVVRIDLVGGYAMQKVTLERSYFRESANEYTDDEDVSWKVQRVAAKCLVALIVSHPKILSKLYDETALRPSIEPFSIEPYRQPCNLRLNPSPFSFDCYEPYLLFQFQALKPIDIEHLPLNLIDKEALHIEVDEVQSSRLELAVREEQH